MFNPTTPFDLAVRRISEKFCELHSSLIKTNEPKFMQWPNSSHQPSGGFVSQQTWRNNIQQAKNPHRPQPDCCKSLNFLAHLRCSKKDSLLVPHPCWGDGEGKNVHALTLKRVCIFYNMPWKPNGNQQHKELNWLQQHQSFCFNKSRQDAPLGSNGS